MSEWRVLFSIYKMSIFYNHYPKNFAQVKNTYNEKILCILLRLRYIMKYKINIKNFQITKTNDFIDI